jgi:hypothetical protein
MSPTWRTESSPIDFKKLFALVAALAVGVFLWDSRIVYPLKLLVVLIHEAGHAIAAKAVGGEVLSITINELQGGLCRFAFEPTVFNKIVTSSAGYLGSALSGALLLFVTLRRGSGRLVLGAMSLFLAAVCLAWGRSLFTLVTGLGLALVLALGARYLSAGASQAVALFLASFNGLYALFDLKDDLWSASRRAGTDAQILADATHLPSFVWAAVWTLFAVALLGAALWFGLRKKKGFKTLTLPDLKR